MMNNDDDDFVELSVTDLQRVNHSVKQCPYCGGEDIHMNYRERTETAYMVCMACYATGPMRQSVAAALDRWNYPVVDRQFIPVRLGG